MKTTTDIIVASPNSFDAILADVGNAMQWEVTPNSNISIDDVVSIVSIQRNAIHDRSSWWKIRREVYARFATHEKIPTRTLAAIPELIGEELGTLTNPDIESIASRWTELDGSTPDDINVAVHALKQLVHVCIGAKLHQLCVFLRTNQPPNDFEVAFKKADRSRLKDFQKAFDSWDESKKYEAHQRYNYYLKEGSANCLDRVLRDFTRPKTARLNLKTDQQKVERYIAKRVKNYIKLPSPDLGDPNDPLTVISLLFDVEYEGYVDLIFDTRPNAVDDFEFVEGTDHSLELYHWHEGLERFACNGLSLTVTLHDGGKVVIEPNTDGDEFDNYIGDMLRDTLIAMRQHGALSNLPLADKCAMCVGGTHTNYFCRSADEITQDGRVQ